MTAPHRFPWQHDDVPQAVSRIPAQITAEERQYLIWLTQRTYTGHGAVVELGTLLGGSSAALAEGLRRQGSAEKVLALDRFTWHGDALRPAGRADGDDFFPDYWEYVRDFRDHLDARKTDLTRFTYDGGPIEILFVDAAKSWELLSAVLRQFVPHLVPGFSRVVFQDFRHPTCYFIPLVIDSCHGHWIELEHVHRGQTVTFTPRSESTLELSARLDACEDDFSWEAAAPLLAERAAAALPHHADWHRLGAATKALIESEVSAAERLVARVREGGRLRPQAIERALVAASRRTANRIADMARHGRRTEARAAVEKLHRGLEEVTDELRPLLEPIVEQHALRL